LIVNDGRRLLLQGLLLALQIVAPPGTEQCARKAADGHSGAGCSVTSEHAHSPCSSPAHTALLQREICRPLRNRRRLVGRAEAGLSHGSVVTFEAVDLLLPEGLSLGRIDGNLLRKDGVSADQQKKS